MRIKSARLIEQFIEARRDPTLAVLEGFHPVKHALRFGATFEMIATSDRSQLERLTKKLAPELWPRMDATAVDVEPELFDQLAPVAPNSPVIALARRPHVAVTDLFASPRTAPLVLLERPSHLGNIGAVIRVAAAAGASGVVVAGATDPWHPTALRGAAGLHFALPVGHVAAVPDACSPLIALHPEGDPLDTVSLPDDAVLAFGSEAHGLSPGLLARAHARIAIPMAPGVSSLNLATAVAVVLYAWRLSRASV